MTPKFMLVQVRPEEDLHMCAHVLYGQIKTTKGELETHQKRRSSLKTRRNTTRRTKLAEMARDFQEIFYFLKK